MYTQEIFANYMYNKTEESVRISFTVGQIKIKVSKHMYKYMYMYIHIS